MRQPAGLLLLTGGAGRRLGGPKHNRPHPAGGTWGGYLVRVFREVFPEGPMRLLGAPLEDHPDCPTLKDSGQGPAAALVAWAEETTDAPLRWWVVACDQVRWTAAALEAWHKTVELSDPEAKHWVLALEGARAQYLGGFLPSALVPGLAGQKANDMKTLVAKVPFQLIPWPNAGWQDLDTPEDQERWIQQAKREN